MGLQIKLQDKYEILTPDGWSDFNGIRKQNAVGIVTISLANAQTLECSLDHSLECKWGFTEAKDLDIGDEIQTKDGFQQITFKYVDKFESAPVFDALAVKNKNVYYTNGMVSHNCGFLGSSGTLITGSKLKELAYSRPIEQSEGLYQYERPVPDKTYALIVDVSRGKGLDYSTFSVIDITKMPYTQACVFRDNMIGPVDFASVIYRLGMMYNEAAVLVEINDIGEQVSDVLVMDYGYENILYTESAGRSGKRISSGFGKKVDNGIRTTKSVKAIGCSILKMLIEQNQLILKDFNTIQELSRFSKKGSSYEAESGAHDDLVMNLVLFAWLTDQGYFKDMTDINTMMALREKTEEQIEENLLPFGFIDVGDEEMDEDGFAPIRDGWSI